MTAAAAKMAAVRAARDNCWNRQGQHLQKPSTVRMKGHNALREGLTFGVRAQHRRQRAGTAGTDTHLPRSSEIVKA
eukprot:scaffold16187_cov101-Isochrysis_galbana.AAC.1